MAISRGPSLKSLFWSTFSSSDTNVRKQENKMTNGLMACYMLLVEWWSGYHEDWSLCSPHLLTWLPALLARQWVSPGCSSDLGGLYWLSPSHIDFHPPQPLCSHLDFHPHSIDFHAHVKRRKRQIPRIRDTAQHLARKTPKWGSHPWWAVDQSPDSFAAFQHM